MILSAFFDAMNGFLGWVVGLFSGIDLPNWSDQLQQGMTAAAAELAGMGVWVNFPLGVVVGGVVLSVFLACLVVKIVLRIVAFLPMIGGAG